MGVWHVGQIASGMRLSTDRIGVRALLWGTLTVLRTGLCHMDGCGARCQARMGLVKLNVTCHVGQFGRKRHVPSNACDLREARIR